MNKHLGYGLLFIIILPISLLFGLGVLTSLPAALQSPVLLLPLFIMACFVIYTIASFLFYTNAVRRQKPCNPSLRDWIRINAFVIILPTALLLLESVVITADPSLIAVALKQFKEMQQPLPMSEAMLTRAILWMFYLLLVYSIAMIIHVFYTFRLLKEYKTSFDFESFGKEE